MAEAQSYYADLSSEPLLLYRTGREKWSLPERPEAQRRLKELCEVFKHPIAETRNRGLGWEIVKIMATLEAQVVDGSCGAGNGGAWGVVRSVQRDRKKPDNRVLGHILYSPAIALGVGEHRFTEDWGIFQIDLANRAIKWISEGGWMLARLRERLLPLRGTISDYLMRNPDMWNTDGESCLSVVKSGNATGTTIGSAIGVFFIVRNYFQDMSINQTSMEWAILNYGSKSETFSEPGDSDSIITDIRGRINGMLTGSAGKMKTSDMTYATPFWWLLGRIQGNGFPNAHLNL
ncbi:hypothetical protein EW145_g2139 [Phellinidium pouzarii]|uniref:Uncharacterized protein n=1 Tax=Phellinidium pouzarii TaxID=167371 RepID=A0A4S4LHI2_9AGAM|nr:hypothetical protein EW145_g2139 [Phellinidium pouzarii]